MAEGPARLADGRPVHRDLYGGAEGSYTFDIAPRWKAERGEFAIFWFSGAETRRLLQDAWLPLEVSDQTVKSVRITFDDGSVSTSMDGASSHQAFPAGATRVTQIELAVTPAYKQSFQVVWGLLETSCCEGAGSRIRRASWPRPLLQLRDIRLTFGGAPCSTGRSSSSARASARRWSGATARQVDAAEDRRRSGRGRQRRALRRPGRHHPLPVRREPDLSGFETALAYVEAGLAEGDDPLPRALSAERVGPLTGAEHRRICRAARARRAALARTPRPSPDILLLDEPTNHLDPPAIEWLERELQSMSSALVLISHDRRFLGGSRAPSSGSIAAARGAWSAGFAGFEAWRDEVLAQEELERHKLDRQIAREDWLRYGVTARRKRNQGRLAGLNALRTAARAAQGGGRGGDGGDGGRDLRHPGDRGEVGLKSHGEAAIVHDFSTPASCAATGSAWSARTARARRRC